MYIRLRASLVFQALFGVSLGGCGALLGVDWDRVRSSAADGGYPAIDGAADPVVPPPVPPRSDGTCDSDRKKCDNLCVSLLDPYYGCDPGSCGVCAVAHGAGACRGGQCAVHACDDGWGAC